MGANRMPEPMTQMAEAAAQLHEMFTAYTEAGFTEQQALYLVGQHIRAISQQPGTD